MNNHFTYANTNYGTLVDILGKPESIKVHPTCPRILVFRKDGVKVTARIGNATVTVKTPVKAMVDGQVSAAIHIKRLLTV